MAAELERTAIRAERRGGAMAVSAAYDRAGRLSVDPELKARRIAKAALAAYDAGKPDRAARLAVEVTSLTTDPGIIADATLLRGQIEYERTSPEADAALASEAARLIMDRDPERAVVMLTEMMCAGRDAGALPLVTEGGRLMAELRLRLGSRQRASADAQISWGDLLSGRPEHAAGPLRAMIEIGREPDADLMHRIVAGFSGLMLADDHATIAVMDMMLAEVRASGALTWIPYAQEVVALAQALRGDFLLAQTCLAEAVALSTEFGMDMEVAVLRATSVWLAAVTGDEPRCRELAAEVLPVLEGRHAVGTALTSWGLGLLDLAAGRYRAAFDALYAVCTGPAKHDFLIRAVADWWRRRFTTVTPTASPISSRRSNGGPCTWTVRSRQRCCGAARRCSRTRRRTTGRHSACSPSTAADSTKPERSCFTANGCAADAAAVRRAPNWPPLWPVSRGWARRPGKRAR
ncbi:hypothetical protein [Lentzea indica]|uniref:hypothetical protein n=1 Tax=Lentzea indica TaxID=2604800 RepID=UPI00143C0310|nr:hypothetical protein [Lentzea indica]